MSTHEILFRGKAIDGSGWAEGQCAYDGHNAWIVYDNDFYVTSSRTTGDVLVSDRFVRVEPATVGQYTGLTDKNGAKVFEGDIISYKGSKEIVRFNTELNIPRFTTGIGRGSSTVPHPYKITKNHAVIGNIHDNPDLLDESP